MSEDDFWEIIDRSYAADADEHSERLRAQLEGLDERQLVEFDKLVWRKLVAAYRWDLWGAAYLINGGASDDGFEYFRRWLVGRGRKVYEAAMANPDSLADLRDFSDEGDVEFEELTYVVHDVYQEKTGNELTDSIERYPKSPAGERWDFDDDAEMSRRLPKLLKRFTSDG